jgi:hypothetical protein
MFGPDDHEQRALTELDRGATTEAAVYAMLALAAAMNNLARAHYQLAETAENLIPPRPPSGKP